MGRIYLCCVLIVVGVSPDTAFSCSTCLCGDPTITTMGTEKPFAGRMRASVDYVSRGEKVGQINTSEHEIDEQRLTYSFSYTLTDQWVVAASLPLVTKKVTRFDLTREQASGLGDADFSVRWYIGKDGHFPARHMWGAQFGLRIPTSTEQQHNGEAIDFDAQPGAGATVPSVGLWYGRYQMPWFFYASTSLLHAVDDGYQGYHAGDVILLTGHSQYALQSKLALQFSIDARRKEQDDYNGVQDDDSGGTLIMATPGVAWTPITDLIASIGYQIPVVENANGRQEEDVLLRAGITYDF